MGEYDLDPGWVLKPGPVEDPEGNRCWPIHLVLSSGGLWYINSVGFHPSGYRLIYHYDLENNPMGFSLEKVSEEAIGYPLGVDPIMRRRFLRMLGLD